MIAHIDADSFFASVLVRQNPKLRGKPLLAIGMGGSCVIAASYEAKDRGVKTGMPVSEAVKLVPDAIKMSSDFREAGLASEQIEKILYDTCPIIEQMSIDEWYLNLKGLIGGLPQNLDQWARTVQQTILKQTALSVSIGVGPSKLLAKMAGEYRKPAGITVVQDPRFPVEAGAALNIDTMLKNRPAPAIPGIGHRRKHHVATKGWHTAWDLATAPTDEMVALCGRPGAVMQRELLGECLSPVSTAHAPPKSVSRARSFRRETDAKMLWAHLLRHVEYTVLKMRRHRLACKGLSVWLRDSEYHYQSAHASLPQPMHTEEALQPYLRKCVRRLYKRGHIYTQIGLALWHLCPAGALQYTLFDEADHQCRGEDLQKTIDRIHERFGRNAITRGAALKVKTGTKRSFEMPVYE